MPEYMLSVHHGADEPMDFDPEEMQPVFEAVERFNQKLQADGHWVFAGGLEMPATASTVDGMGDEVVVTDGPFAESKEFLGGFWVIEAPDLDVALKVAAEGSKACHGKVEVRPFQGE